MRFSSTSTVLSRLSVVTGGVGLLCLAASAFYFPNNLPAVYGAIGGLGLGGLAADRRIKGRHEEEDHALKVGQIFSEFYDRNRGLISPDQLAIAANIKPTVAYEFVSNVAKEYNISPIQTDQGIVFNFPHPQNVLDQLGDNAKNWAANQQQQMLQQMDILQQRMSQLTSSTRVRQQTVAQSQIPPQDPSSGVENPWS